jgi:gliding motility-associated-like protein
MKDKAPLLAFIRQRSASGGVQRCLTIALCLVLLTAGNILYAQPTYQPLAVTGFNQDIVAESGNDALAVTSVPADGSNHVIYSQNFASINSLTGPWSGVGGLPDNGTISNGVYHWSTGLTTNYNFQLADYSANNDLLLSDLTGSVPGSAASGTLTLATPAVLTWVSVLAFSTESGNAPSTLTVTFNFTDGTSAASANQGVIPDWYYNYTPDVVENGMGRLTRLSPTPSGMAVDGTSYGETQMYALNVMVPCASQGKTLQSITFTYISGDPSSNHLVNIMGLAGLVGSYTVPVFATDSLPARCGNNNGLLSITNKGGGTSPFTYSWNTTPAQTTNIITGLAPGSYTCTVADSNGCTFPFTGAVALAPQATLTATASPATVCAGTSTTLTVASSTSTPIVYTWAPGTQAGSSVTVSPAANTTYMVIGKDFYGCADTSTIAVTVTPPPTASFSVNPDPSCSKTPDTVTFTGSASGSATYNWNNFSGATVKSGSGAGPYTIEFDQPGAYDLQLTVSDNGCITPVFSQPVTVKGPTSAPVVTVLSATTNSVTFGWQPVPGASGYQVSVNGGPYITPSSGSNGTTHTVTGLDPLQGVSINVMALGGSCQSSPVAAGTGKTLADAVFIPNSFTPNGDGLNDVFKIYSNLVTAMDMKIFNQWGQQVFATSTLNDGWNGTFKGTQQPMGVYIYVVRVTLVDGTESVRKGSVTLVH